MGRIIDVAKRFRLGEATPRFLFFLKIRGKERSLELPAKTSSKLNRRRARRTIGWLC